ncbi:MAG TPA: alpha/beta hydrolase [Candidatus Blautia faecavium]|uniref:Alpha/beta hydrolase n=1 Tax=Candidatus Blautia faecavium TaxID=2838487 RepID=A0A9D2LV28_9FIRM|nr:alpha/beta hydrolase [Candidatus Blautia faecavium]
MIIEKIKLYEDRDDVILTAYIIEEKGELHGIAPRPAVLICPGGGYLNCSDREAEPIALKFAAMGYHAFVLRYSVYGEGAKEIYRNPDVTLPVREECLYPTQILETGQAMLIIREHAAQWEVDTDRIAVCGFSAGAHNAALYSAVWHTDLLSGHFKTKKEFFRPAAVILCYMVSDYVDFEKLMENMAISKTDKAMMKACFIALTGEENPDLQKREAISPDRLVTKYMPPAYIWATSADNVAPVQHSLRMAEALAAQKVPFELHIFEEGQHGLSAADQTSAVVKEHMNTDAARWVELADAWLKKRFALTLLSCVTEEDYLKQIGVL